MRKVLLLVLVTLFTAMGFAAQEAPTNAKEKKATAPKEARWHGTITRSDKDGSALTVRRRGGNVEKAIHYDSSTKWTEGTKPIDMSEVKDGADVICLGKYDEKGQFIATRIDLRR